MNFLIKLIFLLKKPKIIIVAGDNQDTTTEAIYSVLSQHLGVKKLQKIGPRSILGTEVLILSWGSMSAGIFNFLVKKSRLPVLVITAIGDIPPDRDFFAGEKDKAKEITELATTMPSYGYLILNFDDETVRELDELTNLHTLTFGFQEGTDLQVSDIRLNGGTNFKISYKGNIIPVWLEGLFGKEQTYAALAAAGCGEVFGLNLVQISQALRNYQGLAGRMKLIEGIKNSWILDNSGRDANVYSLIEGLDILGKIKIEGLVSRGLETEAKAPEITKQVGLVRARKIAVLGDIQGIGKYAIEAHESIGEKAAVSVDLLFTIGPKAKFIAEAALKRGIPRESIFQFDKGEDAGIALQQKMEEGDLIFIAGSKIMQMEKIVEEVKAV